MKSARRLMPEEEVSGMAFTNQGNMENYMNQDKGYLVVNREKAQTRNLVIQQKEDLSFREPVGVHLIQAPYMNPKLFIGRESKMAQMQEILRPAIAFAKRHYQEDESIFWLNATSEATLKDSFRLAAEAIFDLREAGVLQDEQSIKHTQRWLCDKRNTRWLLIKRIAPDETLIYQPKVSDDEKKPAARHKTYTLRPGIPPFYDRPPHPPLPDLWWIDDPTLDRYLVPFSRGARAYAELYLATAAAFQQYGSPDVHFQGDQDLRELYDTSYQDLEIIGEGVTPWYRPDSHGVRIVVRAARLFLPCE
ncbi:hypothetical protein AYO21_03693 [Fonsecaea monophora]|uniref:Uncharacterized protein n=1 Tax=Fonsecaea monophora TaxID=254056 RepID=A0A177FCT6_9EURO|nr:hypothetical protein AYO21_03693 [Fonsecaea monophora]OAG41958.1 hypothetical protein AYO21_03693 [Fonsecaea monophora]